MINPDKIIFKKFGWLLILAIIALLLSPLWLWLAGSKVWAVGFVNTIPATMLFEYLRDCFKSK